VSNFPAIGVSAVVQNAQKYTQDLNTVVNQTTAAGQSMQKAATNSQSFGNAISAINPKIGSLVSQGQQLVGKLGDVAEAAGISGESIAAIAGPLAVAAAALFAFIELATRGAGFSDIEHGFDTLTASAGQTADVLEGKLKTAADGTISDMQLMQMTNQALIGVNANLAKSFGTDLPQMMTISRNIALATGQDTTQVFDQMTMAVKRGQTRMLQNIGIVIDQKKAYDDYAKSIGESSKQLDKNQQEQAILNAVMEQGTKVSDALGNSQESNATKMAKAGTNVTNILDNLAKMVQPAFSLILDVINSILGAISDAVAAIAPYIEAIGNYINDGIQAIVSVIQSVWNPISQFISKVLGIGPTIIGGSKNIFDAGANVIGALAGGLIFAANTYVYPAVLAIANMIADFLMGMSPPPKGPLSTIDQGGANVMAAWVGGFVGASLDPISQVAQNVSDTMGSVANESMEQVKAQLLQLDNAIAPFQEQLDLVKNSFDQITAVSKPALDAIDKQINSLQQALANGSTTAAAQIQTLQAQKQAIQDYVDTQQQSVDQAEVQLALAQAQQGSQRAILLTQQQMLTQQQQLTTKQQTAKTPQGAKGKGGGGGGGGATDTGGGGLDLSNPANQSDAAAAGADLANSYNEGVASTAGAGGTALLQANELNLKAAGNRVSAGFNDIGTKISDAVTGGLTTLQTNVTTALNNVADGIKTFVTTGIPNALNGIGDTLNKSLLTPISLWVKMAAGYFSPNNSAGIWQGINDFVTKGIPDALKGIGDSINTSLIIPFAAKIKDLGTSLSHFFNDNSNDSSTLKGIFAQVMTFLNTVPGAAEAALSQMAASVVKSLVAPVINGLNSIIQSIVSFINDKVLGAVSDLLGSLKGLPFGIGDQMKTLQLAVEMGKIKVAPLELPGAATGGAFGPGMLKVGERGQELISSASPISVFPNSFVTALDRLTSAITRPTQASGAYNTTNITSNQTNYFSGIPGAEMAIREMARLNAVRAT